MQFQKAANTAMAVLNKILRAFTYRDRTTYIRNHKKLKSARDPIVGPPDRPGNRGHCPAPVLTRPLKPQILAQIQRNKVDTFQLVG